MFRVPADADAPTFDRVFKVSFGRWLLSKGPERREWMRRRNAAARVAKQGQDQRAQQWRDRKESERRERRGQ